MTTLATNATTNAMTSSATHLWALLIGVDCYMDNRLPDGGWYPSLQGCVRDISLVEAFLRSKRGVQPEHICKLTASNPSVPPNDRDPARKPTEAADRWPTYENMVAAFKSITAQAQTGDQVYIHYSGHGGRSSTAYPALKGAAAFDESLVPTDIGYSQARYLRDVEIAHLLASMVDKGLLVTVVLDSCHSGGATRGNTGAVRRGIDSIDTGQRRTDSLVASRAELEAGWRAAAGSARGLKPGSGWLLEPQGYTLLAACRAQESAFEFPFNGRESNGALTYWLLDTLEQQGTGLSYKVLHDRILAKIHGQFEAQTPQLQGEGARAVFGSDVIRPVYAVPVIQVDAAGERLRINAGQAHFIRQGAQFAIYPAGVADLSATELRMALAEVQQEPGATDTWATITRKLSPARIEPGAQAVLMNPGTVRLQRPVRLTLRDDLPAHIDQQAALQQVRQALQASNSGFAPLAGEDAAAVFQVAVTAQATFEIWDAAGTPIANLRPPLAITDPSSASRLVQRLIHLAKYRNVEELYNHDALSPLAGQLLVELAGKSAAYDRSDEPQPEPFDATDATPVLKAGEWLFVRIRNRLPRVADDPAANVLNVTVLDLESNWAIAQIHPSRPGAYFVPLDPEAELLLPLEATLAPGQDASTDVIKVFATLGTTNFRWLELPPLDVPITRSSASRGGPTSALDALLAAIVEQEPKTRTLTTAAYPSEQWVTAQTLVHVRRD